MPLSLHTDAAAAAAASGGQDLAFISVHGGRATVFSRFLIFFFFSSSSSSSCQGLSESALESQLRLSLEK